MAICSNRYCGTSCRNTAKLGYCYFVQNFASALMLAKVCPRGVDLAKFDPDMYELRGIYDIKY